MSDSVVGIGKWLGLNAADHPATLAAGECAEMRNVQTAAGTVRRRPGFRLLSGEEITGAVWPPYLPPVATVEPTATTFFDVVLPTIVIQGDAFLLRIEAQDRSGNPVATYAGHDDLALVVQADDGGGFAAFAGLALAAGGAPDPTTGWEDGVWEQLVVVADIDGNDSLRVRLSLDSVVRAEDTATFAELASIVVDLPAAVTPSVPFAIQIEALDAAAATLLEFAGTGLSLAALGADEATELTLVDANGDALDPTTGWENGKWSAMAVLADPEDQTGFTLSAVISAASLGEQTAAISQLWQVNAPTSLQSYQEATFRIVARTAAGAIWEDYDGADAAATIELRSYAGVWAAYAGLADEEEEALDFTTGWSSGVWEKTVRFATADGDLLRVVFTSFGIVQWTQTIVPWPISSAQMQGPTACASLSPFAISVLPLDGRGYLLMDYEGQDLSLAAVDQAGSEVSLTDGEGDALDLASGWDEGLWTGDIMFEDAGLSSLVLTLSWNGTALATLTLAVGAAAPGVAANFSLWAPPYAHQEENFPIVLTAYDSFGNAAVAFAGEGLSLLAYGLDTATGTEIALELTHDDLSQNWENGAWLGDVAFADPLACETMRLVVQVAGEDAGEVEVAIARSFAMTVPTTVQTSNTFLLSIVARRADGAVDADFAGEDVELLAYVSSGGVWTEASLGTLFVAEASAWSNGRFSQGIEAPAVGTYRFVLLHQEEEEAVAEMTVTADLVDPDEIDDDGDAASATMDVGLPATVYPGCLFSIGVTAAVEGQIAGSSSVDPAELGGSISVSPAVSPVPSLSSGWDGLHWAHSCKLADPASTGTLVATVKCPPTVIPDGKTPADYTDTANATIGQPTFAVYLPATMRTGVSATLRIVAQAAGGTLSTYDGDGFSLLVEVYRDGAWVADAAALLASTGAAIPTTFVAGRITAQVKLGDIGSASQIRVTALFNASSAGSDTADILSRWDAAITGLSYLHPYLPAQTLEIEMETYGADFDPEDVEIVVEALQDGAWVLFPYLTTSLGAEIDWTENWTGTSFSLAVAISEAGDFSQARIRVWRNSSLAGELVFLVADDVLGVLAADETVYAGLAFDLTVVAMDRRGNILTLYDGSEAALEGSCIVGSGATLSADSLETGWSAGQWDGECTVDAACATFRIALLYDGESVGYIDLAVAAITVAVQRAIYERQQAAGVVAGSLIDPEGSYTLAQLCTEANKFSGSSTNGVRWVALAGWTDKTAAPTYLTDAGYFGIAASGATVEVASAQELYAEVVKFAQSFVQTTWDAAPSTAEAFYASYTGDAWEDLGGGTWQDQEEWSVTKAGAETLWQEDMAPTTIGVYSSLALVGMYYDPTAKLAAYVRHDVATDLPDTRIARTLALYIKGTAPSAVSAAFDALGCGVGNGSYGRAAENALAASAANALPAPEWTNYDGAPPWPAVTPDRRTGETPGEPSLLSSARGWVQDGLPVVLVEWEFSD